MRKKLVDFSVTIIQSEKYKYLRIIYLIAFIFSAILFLCISTVGGDTRSYCSAQDLLLNGSLDHLRTPLYPAFLALTNHKIITVIVQWLIFFVSIGFLYKTLEKIKISSRLIFVMMIVYVCHPVFIYYQNQRIPEALCISLSSLFAYYLVAFIKTEKKLYCWIFHAIILCLILLKPGCVFLLALPVTHLFYLLFAKRKLILPYILPFLLTVLLIGSYGFAIKKTYNVFSLSSVSDTNLYWMLRERDKINLNLIENDSVKDFVSDKIDIKYDNAEEYYFEANTIIDKYGWKELQNVVQSSLNGNYLSILFDKQNIKRVKANLYTSIVRSIDFFSFRSSCQKYDIADFYPYFNFYILTFVLLFYFGLIAKQIYRLGIVPVISILFLVGITANLGSLILTAPNNYGRLIVPSISILLIICAQCLEWFVLFVTKKEKQFKLV
jgi:hypothetical protein